MSKTLSERRLTAINFVIVFYFVLIYIINRYKIDIIMIDVFREILTLPFLIAQIVFLILGSLFLIKNRKSHFLTKLSIILLAISSAITIGSFAIV
ncbi:MAG: hypothetical protein A2X17_04405 [Bacteroidetes bacterium GWF2_41_61]|jgi:hypothetical protein|nr:MAG: hypothetical protein A2X20_02925 [Bacteroidetes bacterium GWE2_40_15]OFY30735.1 MAG: hypothetical protein A2X17_04405 [Bacteroidetes bacterium GWF2_41_61]OFY91135.1 MAG: hypothetical protein A2266_01595 [Bacteroidetes bacterium RIFOXYA12_FULL_40_10]HBG25399.1 hypothetical protein [Rikenellaceae bacterium]HBZ25260.1 hypothetical protein [Rikenellaceae bacterium]